MHTPTIRPKHVYQRGFTTIELMTTVVLLAVLLGIGVPGLMQFLKANRLTSQANTLVSDVLYARGESATRGSRIVICPSSNGSSCNVSDWALGWIVFADTNNNSATDSGEVVLKRSSALDNSTLIETNNSSKLIFRPYGGLEPTTSKTFKLCPSDHTEGRQIFISATGRPDAKKVPCN